MGESGLSETMWRWCAALAAVTVSIVFIAMLSVLLTVEAGELSSGDILLDLGSAAYPFTVQNVMWIFFFVGAGELAVRFVRGRIELRQLQRELLPEDEQTMLRAQDLAGIYERVRPPAPSADQNCLQRLIVRVVLQFQGSRSVDQANSLLNSSLELLQHEIDLKYNMLRYLVWLIPTLGFIGTVIGIALALGEAGALPDINQPEQLQPWMQRLTGKLGVAFNTTMLALALSAVLVFCMHMAQQFEESALNRSGQYCLDNLINRLYEK